MTDPIADMLNRIKNAQVVFHPNVEVPFSNFKYEIAKLLERAGFIVKVEKKKKKVGKNNKLNLGSVLEIILKYENKAPGISSAKRISKPGQRIYLPASKIRKVRAGFGLSVISTSRGLMTDQEARKNKLGGEIICQIW